jgi:uncharacterized protein YprB with RNaseH-like and TPR domain
MPNISPRMCAFDLETTGLCAQLNIVLCAALKEPGQSPFVLRIDDCSADWRAHPRDDRSLVDQLARRLEEYDMWVAFNGACFDIPFLRSRLAYWGLTPLASRTVIDPCSIARQHLRLPKNSLAALALYFGLGHKDRLPSSVWARAVFGEDREAFDQIVAHCKADVALLERLIPHLNHYCFPLTSWGSS